MNELFYKIFTNVILEKTYTDEYPIVETIDIIYKTVLNYFKEGKTDITSRTLNLVLNNQYTHDTINTATLSCSCNNYVYSIPDINKKSCSTIYDESMKEYLKTLFGDVNFYCKFKEVFINEGLAEKLIKLLEDFLSKNYALSFNSVSACSCCNYSLYNSEHLANVNIINSYIDVLNYIKDDNICNNVNKIKIHGSSFGELLPKLEFLMEN